MKHSLLILLSVAALSACNKTSAPAPATASRTDLLLTKNWYVSAQTTTFTSSALNGGTPTTTDVYATYYSAACKKDNFLKFNSNKTLLADEGPLKCSPTDPQTQSGTWDINSDQTKLTLADPSQGGVPLPFDIVELSASTLRIRYSYTSSAGGISITSTNDITLTGR